MGGVSGCKVTQDGVGHRESTVLLHLYLYLHLRNQEPHSE
jgi:hypothetical protein